MTPEPRRVEYVSLRKLRADPRNPKSHHAESIEHSISRFGFVEPIVVDERTEYIASGHGRVETLTRMRSDKKPAPKGVKVTGKGDWLVPVVKGWESASDAEAGAALIAFNRTTELGGWVDEALLDLLQEIDDAAPLNDESREALKDVAVLTKIANDAATIPLNLLSANKETVRDLNQAAKPIPQRVVVEVVDASSPDAAA